MKSLYAVLFACLVATAATADDWDKPEFCKEFDCPRFKMVHESKEYETRSYEKAMYAFVCLKDVDDMQEAVMMSYAHLFSYFHGVNEGSITIPMTVPVVHNISMHKSSKLEGAIERHHRRHRHEKIDVGVGFYLPYMYQSGVVQPPKPNSKEVMVDWVPEFTAHVRSFSGFPSGRRFMKHFEKLKDVLEDKDEFYSEDWALLAVYNRPTEMEDRHNEVALGYHESDKDSVASYESDIRSAIANAAMFKW